MVDETQRVIRELREERGLSRDELARLSGLSLASLYRIETGRQQPRGLTRAMLARALGVRVEELGRVDAF